MVLFLEIKYSLQQEILKVMSDFACEHNVKVSFLIFLR